MHLNTVCPMSEIRTFIAIEIPENIRSKIADLQSELKKIGGRVSWVKPENIHITLKFLGQTQEDKINVIASQLKNAVELMQPFEVTVGDVGAFPNFNRPRVLWVGTNTEQQQLSILAKEVDKRMAILGFDREKRRFSGHLTLGRVKDNQDVQSLVEKLQLYKEFNAEAFVVNEILLIKSQLSPKGSIYTTLKKVMLAH